ncbi:MAG: hypothetical protein ACPG6B_05645 [Oceanihabitans sp.]
MKNVFIITVLGLLLLTSCSDLESDAKKLANLECELKKMPKSQPDKISKKAAKIGNMKNKLKTKYKDEYQEFAKEYRKALQDCK